MKTKLIFLVALLMVSLPIFSQNTTPFGGQGETASLPSSRQIIEAKIAYTELLEETVLDCFAERLDLRTEIAIRQQIIVNQQEQVKSLVLINQEHQAIQNQLASENALLRGSLAYTKQGQAIIFATALVGAACIFVDNKVLNYVGAGLIGFSIYLAIK